MAERIYITEDDDSIRELVTVALSAYSYEVESFVSAEDCLARAAEFDSGPRFGAYLRLYENMYRNSPAYLRALEEAAKKEGKRADKVE